MQAAPELSSLFALEEKYQLKKGTVPVCCGYLDYLYELSWKGRKKHRPSRDLAAGGILGHEVSQLGDGF